MSTLFLTCAVIGAVLLVVQLVLSAFGGEGHGVDHDAHHGDALQLFSLRSLAAGSAFFGLGGLTAAWLRWPATTAFAAAIIAGATAMCGVAVVMRGLLRLERDASVVVERAVGLPAIVYIPIPAALGGVGKVTLTLQGRTLEYAAATTHEQSLETGMSVVVVDVRDDEVLEVTPLPTLDGAP